MCTCDSGFKYATFVGEVPDVPTEMPVLYGRRKMAIRGQEMYCGRANSCLYEQEVEPGFAGPIDNYYDCLHLESFESYEVTTYFPMNGDVMSEEGSNLYCSDYTFHCAGTLTSHVKFKSCSILFSPIISKENHRRFMFTGPDVLLRAH